MVPPDDQILNQSKLCQLVGKYASNTSGAIWWSNLQLIQVAPSGGQICNLCEWHQLMVKFAMNASGAMWFTNGVQVMESISGSVVPLAMFSECLSYPDGHKFYTNLYIFCARKWMSTLWFDLQPAVQMHKHTFYQYRQMAFLSGAQMPKCISITRGIVSLLSGQCQASNHVYFCLWSRVGGNPVQKIWDLGGKGS